MGLRTPDLGLDGADCINTVNVSVQLTKHLATTVKFERATYDRLQYIRLISPSTAEKYKFRDRRKTPNDSLAALSKV